MKQLKCLKQIENWVFTFGADFTIRVDSKSLGAQNTFLYKSEKNIQYMKKIIIILAMSLTFLGITAQEFNRY